MEPKPASLARSIGWIVLLLAGAAMVLGGLQSSYVAYVASNSSGRDSQVDQLRLLSPEAAKAAQGRRGTAAALSVGFGLLFCMIAANPFRRGERWAWWALLLSGVVSGGLILLRIPTLDARLGAGAGVALLVATLVGVLVPVRDFFRD